jgi:hypothetical protein
MQLYRLVNSKYDPVVPGQYLTRTSDQSNQKLGGGMYFALSQADATAFAATRTYDYDHLLTVDIAFSVADFFDLRADSNAVQKWLQEEVKAKTRPMTDLFQLKVHDRHEAFCRAKGVKGLIWSPTGKLKWDELVILESFVGQGALISAAAAI